MQDNPTTPEVVLDPAALATGLADHHVADIAEVLNEQPTEVAAGVLQHLPLEQAVEVLDQPGLEASADLIATLPDDRAVALLSGMSADRVADIFRELEEPRRSALLERLDDETRVIIQRLLAYPPDTAGRIIKTEVFSGPASWKGGRTPRPNR